MNKENKEILKKLIDVIGYGFGIGYSATVGWIAYKIFKDKILRLHETNKTILTLEFVGSIISTSFLVYKAIRDLSR